MSTLAIMNKRQEEGKKSEESKIKPICCENLKNEKAYIKLIHKQDKALDSLKKKHLKEKQAIQKQQCLAVDKFVKQNGKNNHDLANDPTVHELVVSQMKQWSEMIERHRKEETTMVKEHLIAQGECLKKLLEVGQSNQMKQLEGIVFKSLVQTFQPNIN